MIHTVLLNLDWKLVNALSEIDKFGGSWVSIEKRESQTLKHLREVATVSSVGASTRIEGSKMTDDQVRVLLTNLKVTPLEERDAQEVAGYYQALDAIIESFREIEITETSIKNLHNILLKHSTKDWHRGDYKKLSNSVEATQVDGSKQVIFNTANPGFGTEDAMRLLIEWYSTDKQTHPVAKAAIFVYDFLSIHPFQDGNGRLSRLLTTFLLLKSGYSWIQYVSFEHEIESRKTEYYEVLMQCQKNRPGEDVYPWVMFFLSCLSNIQGKLLDKVERRGRQSVLTPRERKIYSLLESNPGLRSGDISRKLDIALPTLKKVLTDMVDNKLLSKHDSGPATNYTIEYVPAAKKDQALRFGEKYRTVSIALHHPDDSLTLKRIIMHPLFDWKTPDEWAKVVRQNELVLEMDGINKRGGRVQLQSILINSLIGPMSYRPEFSLFKEIKIPDEMWNDLAPSDFPVNVTIRLTTQTNEVGFDIWLFYDQTGNITLG